MGIVADIANRLNSQIVSAQDQSQDAKPKANKPPTSSGVLADGFGVVAKGSEKAAVSAVENFVSYDRITDRDWEINSQYQQHAVDVAKANYETQLFAKKVGEALGDPDDQTIHVDYAKYLLDQAKDPKARLAGSAERQAEATHATEQKFDDAYARNEKVKRDFENSQAGLLGRKVTRADLGEAGKALLAAKNEFNLRAEQEKESWAHALELAKLDSRLRPNDGDVIQDLAACQQGLKKASQQVEKVIEVTSNLTWYADGNPSRP
ncbi:hypothetical protein CO669_07460 [Bradyrhizobium sp. Y36]|uniref:hypothetical protein n=1 Tax=Bradyrhizobium sp. Y36 TaxID=2035447 RepID=UPI000BE92CEF|nr:hypothetical protein [Bradyrhizobium sp. Y36]PDT90804.1 hypothetical protein CO669_07460 [Bradyrhizobium sp. Y36]